MITSEDYSEDKIKFQSACTLVTSILLAKLCGKFSIIYLLCAEFLVTQIMLTVTDRHSDRGSLANVRFS